MNYTIQLMEEPKIIKAVTSGEWTPEVDNTMGLDIMKKTVEWQVNKVLIDMCELQFELQVLDIFRRVESLRDQRVEIKPSSSKVALLYCPNDTNKDDDFVFFENAARNRGLPYRVFKEMDDALAWLTE